MRTIASLLLVGCVAAEEEGQLPNVLQRLRAGDQTRVVCFGDSITGVYYHTGSRIAYPDLVGQGLRHLFPRAPVEVLNAGLSGNTTTAGLARMDKEVLGHKPHLVVVMYGMNDMVGTPRQTFAGNLRKIIGRVRDAGAEVLLCTQNNVFPTDAGRPPERLVEFTQTIRDVGLETSTPVADCYAEYERVRQEDPRRWAVRLMGHDIHPSLDGHRVFAQLIVEQITGTKLPVETFTNSSPLIPRTLQKLRDGKSLKVTVVGLEGEMVQQAFAAVFPSAGLTVDARSFAEPSIPALAAQAAKLFDSADDDLLVIGLPRQPTPLSDEQWMRCMFEITYKSVPFSPQHRQREVVWVLPSVTDPHLSPMEREHDQLLLARAHAGDLGGVHRADGDERPAAEVVAAWLREQSRAKENVQRHD
jgi:lysophospholipase L1-like esterase